MFTSSNTAVGLLLSGGLDSSILLGHLLEKGHSIQPFYVRSRLCWEAREMQAAREFLAALASPRLAELAVLDMPVGDLYGDHWSLTGRGVPDAASPNTAVYLPGATPCCSSRRPSRCRLHGLQQLALAVLAGNPFGDATAEFFEELQSALARATRRGGALPPPAGPMRQAAGPATGPPSALAPDLFLHRAAGWQALRPLQQVQGTDRRLPLQPD